MCIYIYIYIHICTDIHIYICLCMDIQGLGFRVGNSGIYNRGIILRLSSLIPYQAQVSCKIEGLFFDSCG